MAALKKWSDEDIYFEYIDTIGYPPAEAKHLFVFSRSARINQPMTYKNARYIIQLKPSRQLTPSADSTAARDKLTVYGFIRRENKEWKLIIPDEIIQIVTKTLESIRLMTFKHFNDAKFTLSESNTMIVPIDSQSN